MVDRRRVCAGILLLGVALLTGHGVAQEGKDKDKDAKPQQNLGALRELPKVERLMAARKEYQVTLEELRKFYIAAGNVQKARWAEDELVLYVRRRRPDFLEGPG